MTPTVQTLKAQLAEARELLKEWLKAKGRLASDDFDCELETRQLIDYAAAMSRAFLAKTDLDEHPEGEHPWEGELKDFANQQCAVPTPLPLTEAGNSGVSPREVTGSCPTLAPDEMHTEASEKSASIPPVAQPSPQPKGTE
jgi:hypothetical protein